MGYVIEEGEYEEVELPAEEGEVTEEMADKSSELRSQAMSALSDGIYQLKSGAPYKIIAPEYFF